VRQPQVLSIFGHISERYARFHPLLLKLIHLWYRKVRHKNSQWLFAVARPNFPKKKYFSAIGVKIRGQISLLPNLNLWPLKLVLWGYFMRRIQWNHRKRHLANISGWYWYIFIFLANFPIFVGQIWRGQTKLPLYFKLVYNVVLHVEHHQIVFVII